ncbi:hypothetical protein A7U60_g4436 [Sanghuangporus baumii]|uniref:Uncharacterized protein n=1 Tax=Sanghuangporus baumii TaxID=108892 RepID=A0A9Q5N574_SANBA|nr:hypothetical protein A7U60_g4436 [Sanghuangporus baumii]
MKRSLRYFLLSVVSVFLLIGLYIHNKRRSSNLPSSLGRPPPKITLIAIWSILGPSPVHLSYFFQSVEANEQIDLLFVQVDKQGSGCSSYSNAPNVQELCLSEDQYHQLHVNFLCRRWRCSEDEKRLLFETIKKNGESDSNNSHFRILRAGVFSAFINPVTTIWGWCDMDEYWGNFTRTFPWDIAPEYDIIVASSQPEFANHRSLFMRFVRSFTYLVLLFPTLKHVLHSFPKFASLSAYMSMPSTLVDAEESEFSHYVFSDEPTFTFLVFEGMLNNYDTALLSPRGVFYTSMQKKDFKDPDRRERLAALVRPVHKKPRRPTFSDQGIEEEARVYYDGYQYPGDIWFDRKHVTFVETGWLEPEKREQKAYFMRREPYGPIMQRLEPRERHLSRDRDLVVDECLYKHWQIEKRESWFRRIPSVLGAGKIFVQHNNAQGDIWNEYGDVIYTAVLDLQSIDLFWFQIKNMKRSSRRYALLAIVSICLLLVPFVLDKRRSTYRSSTDLRPIRLQPPKITLIAVWSILGPSPNYLPYFFQSVEANEQIDLLFVQLDLQDKGCHSFSSAPNVRNNTYFRLLRIGVFRSFIDPATTIWGWCDVDEYWGNFTRTFPWDVAHDFDVLVPSPQPDFANHRMLYMRGHMAFIRNSLDVLDKLHSFPKFSSLSAYMSLPPTLDDAEESEFSHYIFSEEVSFTFLTFEGMLNSYDTALLSPRGVFYTSMQKNDLQDPDRRERLAALIRPENKEFIRPTFSVDGVEEEAHVFSDGQLFPTDVWFDRKHVTFVETGWLKPEKREQKAYFMRREPYGLITQRLEPRERHLSHDRELVVDECLYKHWQVEKHHPWFRRIPSILGPRKIFVQHHNAQADIWNEYGDVVYSTATDM